MPAKAKKAVNWLQVNTIRAARVHFYFVFIYGAVLIAADAGKLYAPEDVLTRWILVCILLSVTAVIWYISRRYSQRTLYYQFLVYTLIMTDILIAAWSVQTERGMASNSVALFALPIATAAILLSRAALFMTASLCTAAYWIVCVRYFVRNFNQGYKLELYTTLTFHSALFFLIASLLWVLVRQIQNQQP